MKGSVLWLGGKSALGSLRKAALFRRKAQPRCTCQGLLRWAMPAKWSHLHSAACGSHREVLLGCCSLERRVQRVQGSFVPEVLGVWSGAGGLTAEESCIDCDPVLLGHEHLVQGLVGKEQARGKGGAQRRAGLRL